MTDTNLIDLTPKQIAQKCPVCNGWGTVSYKRLICHACTGKGFVLIPIENDRKIDYGRKT